MLNNNHWCMVDMNLPTGEIRIYNSLIAISIEKKLVPLVNYLNGKWPGQRIVQMDVMQQEDAVSCGIFAAYYMLNPDAKIMQLGNDDVETMRFLLTGMLAVNKKEFALPFFYLERNSTYEI